MKIKDIKISKQLNIGLGVIMGLVVVLGAMSFYWSNRLWQSTQSLYEHPFTVKGAIDKITEDVLLIRIELKEIVLEGANANVQGHISNMDLYESDAIGQITVLQNSYLGPQSDVILAHDEIIKWKSVREDVLRQLREGYISEATKQVRFDGTAGLQAKKVIEALMVISTFADNKATQFYAEAQKNRNSNLFLMSIILTIIALFASIISYRIIRGIMKPLKSLKEATDDFTDGKFDARCDYKLINEFGELSSSFNIMAQTVENEIQIKEKLSKLSKVMIRKENIKDLCKELLVELLPLTNSQMGAIYLPGNDQTTFYLYESIGLPADCIKSFSVLDKEGDFGLVIATKKPQHINNITTGNRFSLSTPSGSYNAKSIISFPIIEDEEILMIVSIASLSSYSDVDISLINSMTNELAARIVSIQSAMKVEKFAHELNIKNIELQQQAKELSAQTDELIEQNIELEMQKKQLDEVSRLKSSFLSNMSHELRTPLNSVIALSSVLKRKLDGSIPKEEHNYLEVIERNGKNLLLLVNDLLDLSRIEAGKEEIIIRQFDLNNLIEDLKEMLEPQATKKGIQIKYEEPQELPDVVSDENKLRHILQNIIGNAVKFTDKGEIDIIVTNTEHDVCITVKDTGIGIASEHLQFIFDEFRQADESASRRNSGTGLGLAIAKKYALLLGGKIEVESKIGKGSVFTVVLPLKKEPAQKEISDETASLIKPKKTAQRGWTNNESKKVLLVDDSEPAIIQTMEILKEQGYQVFVARSGKEAIEQIDRVNPDGMILDLMMPEMDGFEVLRTIRDIKKNEKIPVLILSAKHITKEELNFLKTNHVLQLIQKGAIDKYELLDGVANLVHERELIDGKPKSDNKMEAAE